MVAGFLYSQFAGRERRPQQAGVPSASTTSAIRVPTAPTTVTPPAAFDGPVQVRTSAAAIFIASSVPALLVTVLFFTALVDFGWVRSGPGGSAGFDWSHQITTLGLPAQIFLMTVMMTIIPSAIFVAAAHGAARALHRNRALDYAGIGALMMIALGIMLLPLGGYGFAVMPLAVPAAIMMAVYRRLAGLEPRSLPEPVLATDIETLVPEDHPSRRTHAVVLNG
jgi:hypothetical protein